MANIDMKKIPYKDIKIFCDYIGISKKKFFMICEKFRNKFIWKKDKGKWVLKTSLNEIKKKK